MFLVLLILLNVSYQMGQTRDIRRKVLQRGHKTITLTSALRPKRASDHVTPEEAVRIKNESRVLIDQLITVGKHVHELLKNLPARKGNEFLKCFKEYNDIFEKFSDLIKHDNVNTRADVERFLQQPHPNIVETDYREWDVRTCFNWSDDHYQQFQQLMYVARELWIELVYIHTYY